MKWRWSRHDEAGAERLARELCVSPILAGMLARRGLDDSDAAFRFLNPSLGQLPSPFLLKDMDKAADRLMTALDRRETIAIYGDYDADGLTSVALLADFLEDLGGRVRTYIPHRLNDGYGLHPDMVEKLALEGTGLIVTVDCGVSDYQAVVRAKELGLDVIITDHHQLPPTLPPALAIVNPMRPDGDFPQKRLAGVGVAFFLAGALRQALRRRGTVTRAAQPELAPLLSLVALGTVADVVPLTRVNRVLVSIGLEHLTATRRPGLIALKEAGGIEPGHPVTASDVAFRLAPRLNAAGRLGSAEPALELLRTRNMETALCHAETIEKINRDRRRVQDKLLKEAEDKLEETNGTFARTIVLSAEDWPRGIVGLAAGKLAEKYRRPTILLSLEDGMARGSGRSIPGFNIFSALTDCRDLLVKFGGHEQAAGLTLARERIEELAAAFEETAAGHDAPFNQAPPLHVEARVTLADLQSGLTGELSRLAPFGEGNPEPVFAISGAEVLSAGAVGREPGHLKLTLGQEGRIMETIGFGLGGLLPELGRRVSVAVQRHTNVYKGQVQQGWKVVDVKKGDVRVGD